MVRPLVTLAFQPYPVDGFSSRVIVNVSPFLTFTVLLLSDWLYAAVALFDTEGIGVADGAAEGAADGVAEGVAVGVVVPVHADTIIMPAMTTTARLKSANDLVIMLLTA
jgi:hypothetical protein